MIMGIAAYEELGITELPIDRSRQGPEPKPADALIISDLHLGSENCQAKPLAAFLQGILDGRLPTKRLIINGDVFDSIDFRRLKKTHWKVLSLIRNLSDKIDITWIAGNHDGVGGHHQPFAGGACGRAVRADVGQSQVPGDSWAPVG